MTSRRTRGGLVGLTSALLTIPLLGVLAPSYADSSESSQADRAARTATAVDTPLEVTHTPAPRAAARRATSQMTVFPVPTSAADLGRITTAPNGDMWFVEEDANKVGRITTDGQISEFNLPGTTTGDGSVRDLDIDAAGNIWVVWDSGWHLTRFAPSRPDLAVSWSLGPFPYGEEVRVGPTGTWVTMSYDEDGIAKIVGDTITWHTNAPECDGALGRGRDSLMWCQEFDRLIKVNDAGSGGTTVPLPADATYPYSVATGPSHSIWFGRDSGGTPFTSPINGNIGWVTSSNRVHTIRTGLRTAPRSLVTGANDTVWFVSVGAAKGIGHITPAGRGAIAKVDNYEPTSVTWGKDGNVWFADSSSNSIGRVDPDALRTTNVNVGSGSQLKPHKQPAAKVASKKVNADKARKRATLSVTCSKGKVPCAGKVIVKAGKKKVATGTYLGSASSRSKITVKLNKAARKLLRRNATVPVTVTLKPHAGKKIIRKAHLTR